MGKAVQIEITMTDVVAVFNRERRRILTNVAATMQTNRAMLFDQEGAYNGHEKWKPLRLRTGMPLSNKGQLRKSIAPTGATGVPGPGGIVEFVGETVTIGTKLAYAAMMNWGTTGLPGGVLKPVRAKALRFYAEGSRKPIFAKSVKIPARRFDQWNDQDQSEVDETILNSIARVFNEGRA